MRRLPAAFWRGGTSNGIMMRTRDLKIRRMIQKPLRSNQDLDLKALEREMAPMFQAIFGSPDPYGRQLNGMGGGISSLSKAMIVHKSESPDYDLDYLFVQVGSKSLRYPLLKQASCHKMSEDSFSILRSC